MRIQPLNSSLIYRLFHGRSDRISNYHFQDKDLILSPLPNAGSRARTSKALSILVTNHPMYNEGKLFILSQAGFEFGICYLNMRSLDRHQTVISEISSKDFV